MQEHGIPLTVGRAQGQPQPMNPWEDKVKSEEMAIIGINGRFPDAPDLTQFWDNLRNGRESVLHPQPTAQVTGRPASNRIFSFGRLEDIDCFDASFFGYTPKEAAAMDPQQRLFLEAAWEVLESAGYDSNQFKGRIGVFAGSSRSTYLSNFVSPERTLTQALGEYQVGIGNDPDHLALRVAYKLNATGPALAIQTTCSTSLVAVAVACNALEAGQCDMAIAGGVSVRVPQDSGYIYEEGGIMSPDGHCRTFDSDARGTIGGNGLGLVVVKRLSEALAAGDYIWAIIKGWSVNNDGGTKVGYTAPSSAGQGRAIREAHARANINARSISYLEAHGTGTPLGDPIEVEALTESFRTGTADVGFCALGSLKPNIGHLDAAAGVAGLLKVVLSLNHREIAPSINFNNPNPLIEFSSSPFFVNTELRPWVGPFPRRAGVSAFGIGGTNAHIVVEEASRSSRENIPTPPFLIPLSAKAQESLDKLTERVLSHLANQPTLSRADAAYTMQVGRRDFQFRRFLLGNEGSARSPLWVSPAETSTRAPSVVFMFPGQGSQYATMGTDLFRRMAGFRQHFTQCADYVQELFGYDLFEIVSEDIATGRGAATRLNATRFTQTALFATEYSLARCLMDLGITPTALIGHSLGEYTAACIANVFSLKDCLKVVGRRGELMAQTAPGAMLGVFADSTSVFAKTLPSSVSLAAVNGPHSTVLSGDRAQLLEVKLLLERGGVHCAFLNTDRAFHSMHMDPILNSFREALATVHTSCPTIRMLSNVTGDWLKPGEPIDGQYWIDHLRGTVRYSECIAQISQLSSPILLEVGPGTVLSRLAKATTWTHSEPPTIPTLSQLGDKDEVSELLKALGKLWSLGVPVRWEGLHEGTDRRRLPLPTYPFEKQRHWVNAADPQTVQTASKGRYELALPFWHRCETGTIRHNSQFQQRTRYILFADQHGVATNLFDLLRSQGATVVTIADLGPTASYAGVDHVVDPDSPEEYRRLFTTLSREPHEKEIIVHCASLARVDTQGIRQHDSASDTSTCFYSLLHIVQAIQSLPRQPQLEIIFCTNNTQSVFGYDTQRPICAIALGLCRVIANEVENIKPRYVDLSWLNNESAGDLANTILLELSERDSPSIIAWRGAKRWTLVMTPIRSDRKPSSVFRKDATYLITGGLGGIGLTFARHIATTCQAQLVLVGRRPRSKIDESEITALEAFGSKVWYVSADVADAGQLKALSTLLDGECLEIEGALHCAGVAGGGIIHLKSMDEAHKVLAPKLAGTLNLKQELSGRLRDFLFLCSSTTAIWGEPGQADYAAANCFLDSLANVPHDDGTYRTVSVNWPLWGQVGMGVKTDIPQGLRSSRKEALERALSNEEAIEFLEHVLAGNRSSVAVLPIGRGLSPSPSKEQTARPVKQMDKAQNSKGEADVDPIASTLLDIWVDLLGKSDVEIEENFFSLGGHSLLAVRLATRIRDVFDVVLPLSVIFEAQTIASQSQYIRGCMNSSEASAGMLELLDQIGSMSEEEAQRLLVSEFDSEGDGRG